MEEWKKPTTKQQQKKQRRVVKSRWCPLHITLSLNKSKSQWICGYRVKLKKTGYTTPIATISIMETTNGEKMWITKLQETFAVTLWLYKYTRMCRTGRRGLIVEKVQIKGIKLEGIGWELVLTKTTQSRAWRSTQASRWLVRGLAQLYQILVLSHNVGRGFLREQGAPNGRARGGQRESKEAELPC